MYYRLRERVGYTISQNVYVCVSICMCCAPTHLLFHVCICVSVCV